MKGRAVRGSCIAYGDFGLQALEPHWITSNQIEAARVAMTRFCKRMGKVWIKIFPDKPISKKPAETRMGKGKGAPEYWVAVVRPGRIMFELSEVNEKTAREAMRLAASKLPIKCKFIRRSEVTSGLAGHEEVLDSKGLIIDSRVSFEVGDKDGI
jgi:large subunit ribosomal protein L16